MFFIKDVQWGLFCYKLCHLLCLSLPCNFQWKPQPCKFHFFMFVFKKNRFSCWEHILGKILSHLFVFILFRVFICGFLDFIIASFSLLVGFIFFICGCAILLEFAFVFLLLNFLFCSPIISKFHLFRKKMFFTYITHVLEVNS